MAAAAPGTFDLIVIGAGPAGAAAALSASRAGMNVALLDEAAAPGGQVYRAPSPGLSVAADRRGPDDRAGDGLREAIASSSVAWHGQARASVSPQWAETGTPSTLKSTAGPRRKPSTRRKAVI